MPISGFRVGDLVKTPAGHEVLVAHVRRVQGREQVLVHMKGTTKAFDAAALRLIQRGAA